VDDAALTQFLDLAFDFACTRPVGDFIDAGRVIAAIDAASTPPRIARVIERFLAPARTRLLERARKSELTLSVWMPEATRDAIASFLGLPAPIPQEMIDELVASERVRESVRATLDETLKSVIQKAFSATPGGNGLRGVIGLGARAAGAASRGLFGGLGGELQRQLEDRVRDMVDFGVQLMQTRIAQRMASEDTARSLGKRRRRAFLDLLKRRESEAARFLDRAPHALLDGLWPILVPHNLARPEFRAALVAEVEAVLTELSTQSVGALLDELGLKDHVRAGLHAHGLPLARAFVATPGFAAWKGTVFGS
jgi:hypothetical protein